MRRSLLIGLAAPVPIGAVAVIWLLKRRDTPGYALQTIATAIDDKDQLAFEEHFDRKRVAQSVVDDLVAATIAEATRQASREDGFVAIRTQSAVTFVAAYNPSSD